MSVVPELERLQLPGHYVYALVAAGEDRRRVFELLINGGYVGFVDRIACDWFEGLDPPNTRSTLELAIDGVSREFEYEIPINKPYVFNPPIVARKWIRWYVTNRDKPGTINGKDVDGSHYYGIMTDGYLAKPKCP